MTKWDLLREFEEDHYEQQLWNSFTEYPKENHIFIMYYSTEVKSFHQDRNAQ